MLTSQLCVHIGFPKTATTTFQQHVFPAHPDIEYIGKFIPGFGYRTDALASNIGRLITSDSVSYAGVGALRDEVNAIIRSSSRRIVLLSSESFVQEQATDRGLVAKRLFEAFGPCRILITIREQLSIIRSFFAMHGQYGQYLFLTKHEDEAFVLPLSMSDWLKFALRHPDRNFPSMIRYADVIDCYCGLFGRHNVGLLVYEEFVHDPTAYVQRLADFLHVDPEEMARLQSGRHEHRSRPRRVPTANPAPVPGLLGRLSARLRDRNPAASTVALSTEIPEPWLTQLRDQYRPGNRRLAEVYGLPLERYGYIL